ncbi:condensation domain-containing protein [Williamsia limnetica]|uniref:Condensation domain-containing protein n=1 Tax=Williamsia limnetica TaxID=882452 RepID=A0A318RKX0_WILLI|nr:condensation domain-containing protein [Williamsia limnetica]PYE14729.1 condensation domain-containing protein [Williamsia limnetica]
MHVTTIDRYLPDAGGLLQWTVDSTAAAPVASTVPPSFNQGFHLRGAEDGSTWLAAAFDIDGPIDVKALERAYRLLITRHGTLHSAFVRRDGEIERELYDPADLVLNQEPVVPADSPEHLRDLLWTTLNTACHPFGFPAYLLAAIDRTERSTVFCGFDHAHVDAYSMSIIIDDLHQLYRGCLDEPGGFVADAMPMTGSFVDYCAVEAEAAIIGPRDPRMRAWLAFFDEHDNTPPGFPLDLGLAPGESAPATVDLRELLDTETAAAFEVFCRANGATVFAGVLAAMARCIRVLGGGPQLSLLFPLHTRRSEQWRGAVGWFTTNAPIKVAATEDFTESVQRAGPALRTAVALGEVPVPHVLAAMGGLNHQRSDIFMVSFVDYRRLPGAAAHENIGAHHVSNVTTADDAQFWISRTERGLALRSRYPGTEAAERVIASFLDELSRFLRQPW